MEKRLTFSFDKEGDILDISIGSPKKAISREMKDDFFVRINQKTKNIVNKEIWIVK